MPKILVIDDDELVRETITTTLKMEGYETISAQDGRQGIEEARRHIPDLIICDVTMPTMDGYATLSALRQDPSTATIPFVFLTGQMTKSDMRQGMELGADDYLMKPVRVNELVAAIQARLQKHALSRKEAERKLDELRVNLSLSLPHEIRTPLSGIVGFAEVLRDDNSTLKPDEISEMASMILKSAHRLGALVENFLTYAQLQMLSSRSEKSSFVGRESTTGLKLHIEETAQRKSAGANRLKDLQVSAVDAEAAISLQSITRIVEELLENALKFSKPGTPIQVTSTVEGDEYVLKVRDHGEGMDSIHISDMGAYRQFGRTNKEQQGSGLGLTISKMMTELYGGRFSIESEVGKGTVVSLRIPSPTTT
ncbi:MAG TPA: hybrid sensor histidine kinase/response regulator [Bacteroidetes bacterium]|nr:MAG: hypothetical protein A2X66_05980 [Ignavibacteria bacterium GWA2_54_16]HCA79873.1 hybrid sensor histidine kinase/response regulator [Bacteroidota bacterium]